MAVMEQARPGSPDAPLVALVDGDWHRCASCGHRFGLGVAPVKRNNRVQCKGCRSWNRLPIEDARE